MAIAKNTAARVRDRENQPKRFARFDNILQTLLMPFQIQVLKITGPTIPSDQLRQGTHTITDDLGAVLQRQRHNPTH